jgi:hypothetical protein
MQAHASAQSAPTRPEVVSIRGSLFDCESGTFTNDDVVERGMINGVTKDALLLTVELAGPPRAFYWGKPNPQYKLRLVATELGGARRVFTLARPIRFIPETGKRYVLFVMYEVQCSSLDVVATVVGPGPKKQFQQAVGMACGEI